MDNPGAVPWWLFGQRPGEAGMQADMDEPTTRSQDAAGLGCQDREVVHVGMGDSDTTRSMAPSVNGSPAALA
jgi:hypothetical protein